MVGVPVKRRENVWPFTEREVPASKPLKSGWSVGRASEEAYKAGYSGRVGFRDWLKSKKLDDRSQGQINLLARSYEDGMAKEDQDSRSKRGSGGHSGGGGHAGSGSGQVSSSGLEKEVASALVNYGAGSGEAREAAREAVKGGGSFDAVFKRALDMVRHKQNPLGHGHWESFDSEKAAKQYARLMEGQGKTVTRHGKDVRVDEDNPARIKATVISALLRREGMLPVPSDRDGIQVRNGFIGATVVSSIAGDSNREIKLSQQAESIVTSHGYSIHRMSSNIFAVTGKDNPARSGAQYRLAQAVLSGQSDAMPVSVARELVEKTSTALRSAWSKRNPEPAAADMYESFHGRPSEQIVTFEEDEHYHEYLSELGVCCGLLVEKEDGKCVALGLSGYEWQGKGKDAGFVEGSNTHSNPKRGKKGPILSSWDQANDLVYSGVKGLDQQLGKVLGNNPGDRVYAVGNKEMNMEATNLTQSEAIALLKKYPQDDLGMHNFIYKYQGYQDSNRMPVFKRVTVRKSNPDSDSVGPNTTLLSSNEDGTQLYLVGGDQSLDLDDLDITGHMATKELITVGDVVKIFYETEKSFDQYETIQYHHEVGEESGTLPVLAYDKPNKRLLLVGGAYHIEQPAFDTSPGIED